MAGRPSLQLVKEKSSERTRAEAPKRFVGELWTAQQRQMHSLHYVVSYRASFKPELPDYCIKRFTEKGAIVLDPFCGRGTTALQAVLLGRVALGSDINPLAVQLTRAKLNPVGLDEIVLRLNEMDFRRPVNLSGYQEHFAPFYHPDTYRELVNLRQEIRRNRDIVNNFIELIAISRLHGHSPGFFSVYSFPQISIPPESQRLINARRHQEPEYRAVAPRIIRKAALALRDGFTSEYYRHADGSRCEVSDARSLSWVSTNSVDLIVTSPPFLDKVDYVTDNWLECWLAGVSPKSFGANLVMCRSLEEWSTFIREVLAEMLRVLKPGAHAVVEVGEVETSSGLIFLDELVAREAENVQTSTKQLQVSEILINQQNFTKLANCFKVDNNRKGTNTNRLVVMKAVPKGSPKRADRRRAT